MKQDLHDDTALLAELAGLIERLRMSRYEQVLRRIPTASATAVEAFFDLLSRHLLYEENILFPALRRAAAKPAGSLSGLRGEHERLREFGRDLLVRVRQGDTDGACEVARLFLAALLDHVDRESKAVSAVVEALDAPAAGRLKASLEPD